MPFVSQFDLSHFRLLWLIYNSPTGLTGRELVAELRARGWCDPDFTPADLGLEPDVILSHPRAPANQP